MTRDWTEFLVAKTDNTDGYPTTFDATAGGSNVLTPETFDPAMRHFARAFRAGDPQFDSPVRQRAWQMTRRLAMETILRAVAAARCRAQLVLRGSVLLKAWFGEVAREPGDLDWVACPQTINSSSPEAIGVLTEVLGLIERHQEFGGGRFLPDAISVDEIWAYERASGRRIAVPWQSVDGLRGVLQIDVVFGETLWLEPITTQIPCMNGPAIPLQTVSQEHALASKLLWLMTDCCPQGKDLFDAALLAGTTTVRRSVLSAMLREAKLGESIIEFAPAHVSKQKIDWENFAKAHTWVTGTADERIAHLTKLLWAAWDADE